MAMPLRMKRMVRERVNLEKPNDDYFCLLDDADLFSFHAYVIGPADTLYAYKFVKLRFDIPEKYPMVPPKCTFIQSTGGRLHPNLYVEGKVCLSILGTWPGEKWAWAMTVDTVLITIRSLLDNSPYKHEPKQKDNLAFNQYVQYTSWKSLLIDYVNNEHDAAARAFLEKHISQNGTNMINELQRQARENHGLTQLSSPYGGGRNSMLVNYEKLLQDVIDLVEQCQTAEAGRQSLLAPLTTQMSSDPLGEQIDSSKSLNETRTFQMRQYGFPLMAGYVGLAPEGGISAKDFAKSQKKIALAAVPPSQINTTATTSPLKRKYAVTDLT